ncbi:hypothetical protein L1987_48461 [Smallanthus sonchifolius]|uniref:Uncharacterized protein n=1 Tax=Smallanthus sonchifolius TaxID=185202 RepID=A0ACB9FTN6_9ASTR|nr:hypothetical protein L1987_48461 [Smallanthus sonchifolius]
MIKGGYGYDFQGICKRIKSDSVAKAVKESQELKAYSELLNENMCYVECFEKIADYKKRNHLLMDALNHAHTTNKILKDCEKEYKRKIDDCVKENSHLKLRLKRKNYEIQLLIEKREAEKKLLTEKMEKFANTTIKVDKINISGKVAIEIIEAQIHDKVKYGLEYKSTGENIKAQVNDKVNSEIGYKSVPPPFTTNGFYSHMPQPYILEPFVSNVYPLLEPKRNSEANKV